MSAEPRVSLDVTNCKFSIDLKGVRNIGKILSCFLDGCCRYARRRRRWKVRTIRNDPGETFCTATIAPKFGGVPPIHLHINRVGHINVTGSKQDPRKTLRRLSYLLAIRYQRLLRGFKIDNLSTAGRVEHLPSGCRLDLSLLGKVAAKDESVVRSTSYAPERFPSLMIRTNAFGTLSVFSNGKLTVVGTKRLEHVSLLRAWVGGLVKLYYSAADTAAREALLLLRGLEQIEL